MAHAPIQIFVHSFNRFSEAELDRLERYCDSLPLQKAYLNSDEKSPRYDDIARITQFASIPQTLESTWFYQRLIQVIQVANASSFQYDLQGLAEPPQFLVYHGKEGGHFGWHFDTGPTPPRKLSVTIQLTDPSHYEGGTLEFNIGNAIMDAPKERGVVVAFPSYMMHRVTPVTSGIRKSIVVWVTGPPFR